MTSGGGGENCGKGTHGKRKKNVETMNSSSFPLNLPHIDNNF